jgi:hypothetical protein
MAFRSIAPLHTGNLGSHRSWRVKLEWIFFSLNCLNFKQIF